ncbi:MAG: hypothetical protein KatS3mg101_0867 [Patescibacteria group bacterium]|nr:MAG: hypothetical protein KatS3mg101_0867 [Patescibacteria group bacterium]
MESIGRHYNKDSLSSIERGKPAQVFLRVPYTGVRINNINRELLRRADRLFIHAPYVWNISQTYQERKIVEDFLSDLYLAGTELDAKGIVVHVGKSVKMSVTEAINNQRNLLKKVCEKNETDCKVLLETPAGQGTELLTDYDEFVDFCLELQRKHDNFGVCIDTAHVWSLGYLPHKYLKEALRDGLRVELIHFNGSLKGRGSRVDRHAIWDSDYSKIPVEYMLSVIRKAERRDIPLIIE